MTLAAVAGSGREVFAALLGGRVPPEFERAPERGRERQGSDDPPEPAPDLTMLAGEGWSSSDVVELLTSGMAPDGDMIGGVMRGLVVDGTSRLAVSDREALAAYVLSRPVNRHPEPGDDTEAEDP